MLKVALNSAIVQLFVKENRAFVKSCSENLKRICLRDSINQYKCCL